MASANFSTTTTTSFYLEKPLSDTLVNAQIEGTYGTVTFVFEGSINGSDSSASWFALPAGDMTTGASNVTGTIAPADNATYAWRVPCEGCIGFRMRVTAIASGTFKAQLQSYAFGTLPVSAALSSSAFSQAIAGTLTITTSSATAMVVGPNGATNPTLKVVTNVSSQAGGLSITGGADAVGVALAALGSNTNEPLKLDAKGSGTISIGTVSTGGAVVRTKVATVAVGGTAIGNANAVDEGFYYVTGADNTAAVILPASVVGKVCEIKNTVANKVLIVFPPASSQINANGANNAYNMAAGATRRFVCSSSTLWYTDPETIA